MDGCDSHYSVNESIWWWQEVSTKIGHKFQSFRIGNQKMKRNNEIKA